MTDEDEAEALPELRLAEGDDVVPLAEVTELAYAGAPEGSGISCRAKDSEDSTLRVAVLLRPDVPMRQLVAAGPVAALGSLAALEQLGADPRSMGIDWPYDLVGGAGPSEDRVPLARISTKAGYSDGMFVVLEVDVSRTALDALQVDSEALPQALQQRLVAAVRWWEKRASLPNAQAGPWAPFLQEYFDRVPLLGHAVNVCYPNGRVYARGVFVGIDVWGRATVRTLRAGDIEFPPEKFRIEPQG